MDLIRNWAFSVSAVVVFGTLAEAVMPSDEYRKYVHLVLGLLLIITISSPVISLLGNGFDIESFLDAEGARTLMSSEISPESIEKKQKEDVITIYKKTLENNIKTRIETKIPELKDNIKVSVSAADDGSEYGTIEEVDVVLSGDDTERADEIKTIVSAITGSPESGVMVTRE